MMRLKIKTINFDFEHDGGQYPTQEDQDAVINSVVGKTYEVEDEDFLADAISEETGWCVFDLDYEKVSD